ncbi:ATP synthase F1 subunit delta [Patescibacteria group bacterium]|nr:ATP synthase F1 subunit delta [Patescibacteria group bacterium]MDL1953175.1 ATP synthase F1 subunit delta [Candidatus Uhrbacteria bacterium UHB]RIL00369.1 MAG: ATP synthase F1 subunit delta [Candidatus Uhrbacteria bacterium]
MSTMSLRSIAEAYVSVLPKHTDAVQEISRATDILAFVPELRAFVGDASIPVEDRLQAIRLACPSLSKETVNVLLLLGEHGMHRDLDRFLLHVTRESAVLHKLRYATVTSAVRMKQQEQQKLEAILSEKLKRKVRVTYMVETAILGGLRISLDDWLFDASVQGRLHRLRLALHTT